VRRRAEDSTAWGGPQTESAEKQEEEICSGGKAENDESCRSTQSFRAVESRFMRQR